MEQAATPPTTARVCERAWWGSLVPSPGVHITDGEASHPEAVPGEPGPSLRGGSQCPFTMVHMPVGWTSSESDHVSEGSLSDLPPCRTDLG